MNRLRDPRLIAAGALALLLIVGVFFIGYGVGIHHEKNNLNHAFENLQKVLNPTPATNYYYNQ